MENLKTFEELEAWRYAREVRLFVSRFAKTLPKQEEYRLKDQVLRSSRSIGNNIAEGFGRYFFKENVRFCTYGRGSLTETLDHMIIARDEEYISTEIFNEFRELYGTCLRVLNGYIAYLRKAGKIPDSFQPADHPHLDR